METTTLTNIAYDDPEIWANCVSAVTLKSRPTGLLEDWLSEGDVDISISVGSKQGPRSALPWLDVDVLGELSWAKKIRDAIIQSDHLEGSSNLHALCSIERLTIVVRGHRFDDADVEVFWNAIENMGRLQQLSIVVPPEAYETAQKSFIWKKPSLDYNVVSPSRRRR